MKYKINVLIITYNQEGVIGRALESVLIQKEWGLNQIIVCDDCSTDNNWEVISRYVEMYPNIITAYKNTSNLGIYGNCEKLVSLRGNADLFYILSGDDALCDGLFRHVHLLIEKKHIDVQNKAISLYFDWKVVTPKGKMIVFRNDKIEKGKKPKAIILENVRSLRTHNNGKTYKEIHRVLQDVLGYKVFCEILNSADYGVPQTRNRTYIVCFDNQAAEYEFPMKQELNKTLQDLLEHDVDNKYFLSDKILPTILSDGTGGYKAKSEIDLKIARPLCATMAKMHRACQDNYVTQKGRVRRLTPRECARLQGFEDSFEIPVSDCQAYKQFGNAVTVNVSKAVAQSVKDTLKKLGEWVD